jgi:ParB-like chromosome segregation protein Spo0J
MSVAAHTAGTAALRPIAEIQIGHRHRQDYGDIDSLAQNIADVGLLHPVVITPGGRLIAGERRLLAFKQLGRETIPVTVVDLKKVVLGEYAENTFRKKFTMSEGVAIAAVVEPLESAAAKELMVAAHASPGKFPELAKGNALDKVGRVIGKDRKTLDKAKAICEAAKQDPERFGKAWTI